MQLFNCPWCGPRDQSEFTYGREAAPIPALDAPAADWYTYVYERDNPAGPHAEWWHHNHGCRQWLEIVRDTSTHDVLSIQPARSSGDRSNGGRSNGGQTPISNGGQTPISPAITPDRATEHRER